MRCVHLLMNEENDSMRSINQRDVVIDIIKGIGIVFMVLGHCGSPIICFIWQCFLLLLDIAINQNTRIQ